MNNGALTDGVDGTVWAGSLNSLKEKINIIRSTTVTSWSYKNPMSMESKVSATFEQMV